MKKILAGLLFALSMQVNAAIITMDQSLGDYGFNFSISSIDNKTFSAALTNTSTGDYSNPVIDLIAFNLFGDGVVDATSVSAGWSVDSGGNNTLFKWIGDANSPGERLGIDDTLLFDIVFDNVVGWDAFILADSTSGAGIGGGEDFGQVAVSFQQLGMDGEDSDLLAGDWLTGHSVIHTEYAAVNSPGTLFLFGLGLVGMVFLSRKRNA